MKRSKLAVWSFVLSLTPFILFLITGLLVRWGLLDWKSALILIFGFYYLIFINIISLILSIISLFNMKKYRLSGKVFAILGLVIDFMFIIIEVLLWFDRNQPFHIA